MQLVRPSIKYKDSFLKADEDVLRIDGRHIFRYPAVTRQNFRAFCKALKGYEKAIDLPDEEENIPVSFWWLVDKGEFIGRLSIRHRLSDELLKYTGHIGYLIAPAYRRKGYGTAILKLALAEAAKLGLEEVLVTCDHTNLASAKIIENNGGRFENEVPVPGKDVRKKRYWIALPE